MKILVTGASGYIGSKLAHALAVKGNTVHALVRSAPSDSLLKHPNIKIFTGDILNKESLAVAIKNCKQVYHTAGVVRLWAKDPDIFYQHNVSGTQNVLEAAWKEGVSKFVYTSSCGVWGSCNDHMLIETDPRTSAFDNDYDLSKFLAEKSVKEYGSRGLFTVIVNPPRVYGPGPLRHSSGVNRFILRLLRKKIALLPWRLETKANYAFIDDVVNGHLLAMDRGLGGERYILGGENISYRRLVETVNTIGQTKNLIVRMPPVLFKTIGHIELVRGKLNGHDPLITPNVAKRLQSDKMFDCSKAIRQLGYHITPFEEGLTTTINHLKNNLYENEQP
jgi:nucleoside-diphosphate-sugar epimerase